MMLLLRLVLPESEIRACALPLVPLLACALSWATPRICALGDTSISANQQIRKQPADPTTKHRTPPEMALRFSNQEGKGIGCIPVFYLRHFLDNLAVAVLNLDDGHFLDNCHDLFHRHLLDDLFSHFL